MHNRTVATKENDAKDWNIDERVKKISKTAKK